MGAVPFGYRVENRALHVVEEHAEFVRELFRRYLEFGSVVRVKAALDAENVRSPVRICGTGRAAGGGLLSHGHIDLMLSNPIYVGRLRHKDQIHDGLHAAIVDQEVWDRVQHQLAARTRPRAVPRRNAEFFLAGKLYDDRGNRMGPSHTVKGGRRWPYYARGLCLKAARWTPDRSRACLRRKSKNRYSMRPRASSPPDARSTDLARCLRSVFPGGQSARIPRRVSNAKSSPITRRCSTQSNESQSVRRKLRYGERRRYHERSRSSIDPSVDAAIPLPAPRDYPGRR